MALPRPIAPLALALAGCLLMTPAALADGKSLNSPTVTNFVGHDMPSSAAAFCTDGTPLFVSGLGTVVAHLVVFPDGSVRSVDVFVGDVNAINGVDTTGHVAAHVSDGQNTNSMTFEHTDTLNVVGNQGDTSTNDHVMGHVNTDANGSPHASFNANC